MIAPLGDDLGDDRDYFFGYEIGEFFVPPQKKIAAKILKSKHLVVKYGGIRA